MTTPSCDAVGCGALAAWRAFASYPLDDKPAHPRHATYPAPMIRACSVHLASRLVVDAELPGSTRQWLVVPVDVTAIATADDVAKAQIEAVEGRGL